MSANSAGQYALDSASGKVLSRLGGLFRRKKRAKPQLPPVRAGYTGTGFARRNRRKLMTILGFFCFFYGASFAIFNQIFLLQFTIPLVIVTILMVWVLPNTERPPLRAVTFLFWAFLIALVCWPDYLALALPGLPWITALRLTTVPLAFFFLISLSVSQSLRNEVMARANGAPSIWKAVVAYALLNAISISFSTDISFSFSRYVVMLLYWFLPFWLACYIFAKPGKPEQFSYVLWGMTLFVCAIGLWEWHLKLVPWANHIPSFLAVSDETVTTILTPHARIDGEYRVQGKFTTALGLAEYLALVTPFFIHLMLTAEKGAMRVGAFFTILLVLYIIIRTDSRLGIVGFGLASMLSLLVWGALRWRDNRTSLLGPAVVIAYPAFFSLVLAASFFVGRIKRLVWGTGAAQMSTDVRHQQLMMGLPKIEARPWGYGVGRGGEALGYFTPGGQLTIDSYFLAELLEIGVLGFLLFLFMMSTAVWHGGKALLAAKTRDTLYLAPFTIAVLNFFVIRSIFSQLENNPLAFAMMGAICALCYRVYHPCPSPSAGSRSSEMGSGGDPNRH